jgi:hypothetical protein
MLYLEMPVGVGFSYCDFTNETENCPTADAPYEDNITAQENLHVLRNWFDRFPEYKTKDLYISGESYAGIYVPYLMNEIDTFNTNATDAEAINLKGMMVGNGCTNWTYDALPATVDMVYWHSLISQELHDNIVEEGCVYVAEEFENEVPTWSDKCMEYYNEFATAIAGINIYNIFGECYGGLPSSDDDDLSYIDVGGNLIESRRLEEEKPKKKGFTARDYTPWFYNRLGKSHPSVTAGLTDLPPCTFGEPLITWTNDATVRTQLHIPEYVQPWTMCADKYPDGPDWGYTENLRGSQWVWEKLQGKYRMLKFSGD